MEKEIVSNGCETDGLYIRNREPLVAPSHLPPLSPLNSEIDNEDLNLCQFLDNVHCTDPRSYKNGVPDDEKDLYLCTLGKFGMPPRWCKEYPYQKKEGRIKKFLLKVGGFF